jgi:hypothetical protein
MFSLIIPQPPDPPEKKKERKQTCQLEIGLDIRKPAIYRVQGRGKQHVDPQ